MDTKKIYNIIFIASGYGRERIEALRIHYTGSPLVDMHPPHVTLKRRFSLKASVSEEDVVKKLEEYSIVPMTFYANSLARWSDSLVLTGKNALLRSRHLALKTLLEPLVISLQEEWEGKNYIPHLNIIRDPSGLLTIPFEEINITELALNEIVFNEYDPSPIKDYSRIVWRKKV